MTTDVPRFPPRRAPSRERTKLVWTGITVLGIVGGVLAARSSTMYLRHRLTRELARVTGMEAQIGELRLSPDGSVLRDLRLTGNGRRVLVSVVELDTDVEALLAGRTACIEVARIERVDVVLGRGSPSREGPDSPAERASSGEPAAGIDSRPQRVAAGLRRLLAPGGRVDLEMVRVFVPNGAEAAPSIPVLQSTGGVPLSEVSPFLVHAVLAHEDATFFEHAGFAPFAIEDALRKNLERGRMAFGASTISMQLAKNLFLTRDKTLARKVDEVFLTWWLESSLSKTRILELYLNVIEYGPRIYGLRRASRVYFGDEPAELTPGESVFLASLLPTPADYFRQFRRRKLTASSKRQMAFLLRHMRRRERIDDQALRYGLSEVERIDHGKRFGTSRSLWDDVGSAAVLPVSVPVHAPGRVERFSRRRSRSR